MGTGAIVETIRSGIDRHTDLRIRWALQNDKGALYDTAPVLLDVGGRWDKISKSWTGAGEQAKVFGLHPGQLDAARWLVEWFQRRARGEQLLERGAPIYSLLLDGGRRGGKTDLAAKAGVTSAVLRPGTFTWLVSETMKKTEELQIDVLKWLHPSWFEYLGAPNYSFTLANGSVIWLRTANDPEALRMGRCDFAVLNEAQLISERAFAIVRAATSDTGGLTVLAANPPESPIGYWIERFREQAVAGKRQAREFFLDARANPHVDHASLEAMREELDERTFRRDILGEFLPRADVVFYGWADGRDGNIAPTPQLGEVTHEFLRQHLRRDLDGVIGIDLQKNPVCAVVAKFYRDPLDPEGEPLVHYVDEVVVEEGYEAELSDALIAKGYDPRRFALIVDASGSWQGVDRKKKTPSFDIFKQLGWPNVFKPDQNVDRNPPILERVKCANTLFKNAHGKRRVFSAPENLALNQALKLWENRNGAPYRRSDYAHLCDAATYILWRFWPRTIKKSAPAKKEIITQIHKPRGPRFL